MRSGGWGQTEQYSRTLFLLMKEREREKERKKERGKEEGREGGRLN
jgi:hypothetical protein